MIANSQKKKENMSFPICKRKVLSSIKKSEALFSGFGSYLVSCL